MSVDDDVCEERCGAPAILNRFIANLDKNLGNRWWQLARVSYEL